MTPLKQTHLRDHNGILWCRREGPHYDVAFNHETFMSLPHGVRCQECQVKRFAFLARDAYNPNAKPCPTAHQEITPCDANASDAPEKPLTPSTACEERPCTIAASPTVSYSEPSRPPTAFTPL